MDPSASPEDGLLAPPPAPPPPPPVKLRRPRGYVPRRYLFASLTFLIVLSIYVMRVFLSVAIVPISESEGLSPDLAGLYLSAFYFGYIFGQVPGGWLSRRFGFKLVILTGVGGSACATLILPLTVSSPALFVGARVLCGLFEGVIFPSAYHFMSLWYPKSEKGTVAALISSGGAWGTVLSNGLSPLVVAWGGWPWLCYLAAGGGLLVLLPWLPLTLDSPGEGRDRAFGCITIHPYERQYVLTRREQPPSPSPDPALDIAPTSSPSPSRHKGVPWGAILTHPAIIGLCVFQFAAGWSWYVFLSWLPTYLKEHLHFDLKQSGFIAIFPYLVRPVVNVGAGVMVDVLVNKKLTSLEVARKICQALATFIPATVLVLMSFIEFSPLASSILIITAIGLGGFDAGANGNALDLSPSYASIIYAICNTISALPGIIGVYLTGWILNVTGHNWQVVFLLAAGLAYGSIIVYGILGKAEVIDFDAISESRRRPSPAKVAELNGHIQGDERAPLLSSA